MLNLLALASLSLPIPTSELASPTPLPIFQRHEVRGSPFDGLRWKKDQPEVDIEGTWYQPIAIDDVPVADILAFCDQRWPGMRQKRFGEDLVEAMLLMEHEPGKTVKLDLIRLSDQQPVTLDAVEMSNAKRNAIRNRAAAAGVTGAMRPIFGKSAVNREEALTDLRVFGERLRDQFSYLTLRGIDLDAELERIAAGLDERVDTNQFAQELHELLMRFGDGHASVTSPALPRRTLYAPALLATAMDGVVAFEADRSAFVDRERPYVIAIDGRPVDEWIEAMRPTVVAGSPQWVRSRALRSLRDLNAARERMGLPRSEKVTYSLSKKPEGEDVREVERELSRRRPIYGVWPEWDDLGQGEFIQDAHGGKNVGLIRLEQMDDDKVPALREKMDSYKTLTDALIVDVRGNGGGSRGLLMALAGYLIGPDDPPVVGNVSAYIESERFGADHLGPSRHLYRRDDPHWSDAQRQVIDVFAADFEPEWELPDGFSDWHYLVMDRTGHADEYHFEGPVVVLSDAGCFSATDIFLAAMGELPQVTLMGTASGGGSARVQGFTLPSTGIRVRCASMASFQPNGKLYDGNGVGVDVEVKRSPESLLRDTIDNQFQAAVEFLMR